VTDSISITLLTQPHCSLCDIAKEVLARVGQRYPLTITETDLRSEDGRRLAGQAGVVFAPGVLIDGHPFSFGRLSERRLTRELDRRIGAHTP
jgi:Glutaredoxin-like domain (DUF836)